MADLTRSRQLLLVALTTDQPGEALNALKLAVKASGLDAHKLADRLTKPAQSWDAFGIDETSLTKAVNQIRALNQTVTNLTEALQATKGALDMAKQRIAALEGHARPHATQSTEELAWRRQAQQLLAAGKVSDRESDFLQSILSRGWSELTERQNAWLQDIWTREMR